MRTLDRLVLAIFVAIFGIAWLVTDDRQYQVLFWIVLVGSISTGRLDDVLDRLDGKK